MDIGQSAMQGRSTVPVSRLVVCQELSPVKLKSAVQGRLKVQVSNGHRAVSNAG